MNKILGCLSLLVLLGCGSRHIESAFQSTKNVKLFSFSADGITIPVFSKGIPKFASTEESTKSLSNKTFSAAKGTTTFGIRVSTSGVFKGMYASANQKTFSVSSKSSTFSATIPKAVSGELGIGNCNLRAAFTAFYQVIIAGVASTYDNNVTFDSNSIESAIRQLGTLDEASQCAIADVFFCASKVPFNSVDYTTMAASYLKCSINTCSKLSGYVNECNELNDLISDYGSAQ